MVVTFDGLQSTCRGTQGGRWLVSLRSGLDDWMNRHGLYESRSTFMLIPYTCEPRHLGCSDELYLHSPASSPFHLMKLTPSSSLIARQPLWMLTLPRAKLREAQDSVACLVNYPFLTVAIHTSCLNGSNMDAYQGSKTSITTPFDISRPLQPIPVPLSGLHSMYSVLFTISHLKCVLNERDTLLLPC
jgi:hypothetical protein